MARILIVDDDENLRTVLRRGLSQSGHEVVGAEDGRRAMALIRSDAPDLVITDINMPEMDGIEIINELQALLPPIPVIAMSGGGRMDKEVLLENASLLGAVETLEKPFDLADLKALVARLLPGQDG